MGAGDTGTSCGLLWMFVPRGFSLDLCLQGPGRAAHSEDVSAGLAAAGLDTQGPGGVGRRAVRTPLVAVGWQKNPESGLTVRDAK